MGAAETQGYQNGDGTIRTQLERIEPITGEPDQSRKAETEANPQDQPARLTDRVGRGNVCHPRILLCPPCGAKPFSPVRHLQPYGLGELQRIRVAPIVTACGTAACQAYSIQGRGPAGVRGPIRSNGSCSNPNRSAGDPARNR